MSPEQMYRDVENSINVTIRHCKIGRVFEKPKAFPIGLGGLVLKPQPVITGDIWNPQPWWQRGPWCNQSVA